MLQVHVLARVWRFKSSRRHMKKIIITGDTAGNRIDKFLVEEVFFNAQCSRSELVKNIQAGNISVNGKKVKASYVLKIKDEIRIELPSKETVLSANPKIKLEILHQDKDIIVINKPAGLAVHPTTFEGKDTLVNGLIAKFPEIKNVSDGSSGSEFRPGIVHRLDKDTSGVMVVARRQEAFDELKKIFQKHQILKKYLVIVQGRLEKNQGTIEKAMARSSDYKKQVIANRKTKTKIRSALTEFKVLEEMTECSLVEARPQTGRTHQIRVHLNSLGNPVVGDKLYGSKKNRTQQSAIRQMLHAESLSFELFGKTHSFRAEPAADFRQYLTKCQEKDKIKRLI